MTLPRAVLITRKTDYELLIEHHATANQARFFLETRGQTLASVLDRHHDFERMRRAVRNAVPKKWRWAQIEREDLHRFLFEPDDVITVLGQDGLVANVAKYLDGQPVIGLNSEPARFDGILVPHRVTDAERLFNDAHRGSLPTQQRTMVCARLDDGQELLAVNEVFIGHRSHQSARYEIDALGNSEVQSSSGVVVASGTGATGWMSSIMRNRMTDVVAPTPEQRSLTFFVREAFVSRSSHANLTDGCLAEKDTLAITSRMNEGGVVFGDGIEDDYLTFEWGQRVSLSVAQQRLNLVATGETATRRRPRRKSDPREPTDVTLQRLLA